MNDKPVNSHDHEAQARAAFSGGQDRHHRLHGPGLISECADPVCRDLFLAAGWRYTELITGTAEPAAEPPGGTAAGDDDVVAWAVAACYGSGETVPLSDTGDILAVIAAAQAALDSRGDRDHILASLKAWAVSSDGTGPSDLMICVELSHGLRIAGDILPADAILTRLPTASTVETRSLTVPAPVTWPPMVAVSAVLSAVLDNARATIGRAWQPSGPNTWQPPGVAASFAHGSRPVHSQVAALVGPQVAAEWEAAVLDGTIDPDGILALMLETFQQGTGAQNRSRRRRRQLGSLLEQQLANIRAGVAGAESVMVDIIAAEAEGT
jgi:hypothetical protein